MNAPHLVKMVQRLSYQHWPWRNGVNRTPPFLHFQLTKAEQRPLRTFRLQRDLDERIYSCKLRNEKKDLIQVCSEFSSLTSKLYA
jgi:hypothetical protein